MENFSRDALGRFFRPTLADVRQRFKEGHMVTEAEPTRSARRTLSRRSEEKAELRRLRDRRASDDPNVSKLTSEEEERLSKEDAETERIAKIAESLARTWGAEARVRSMSSISMGALALVLLAGGTRTAVEVERL